MLRTGVQVQQKRSAQRISNKMVDTCAVGMGKSHLIKKNFVGGKLSGSVPVISIQLDGNCQFISSLRGRLHSDVQRIYPAFHAIVDLVDTYASVMHLPRHDIPFQFKCVPVLSIEFENLQRNRDIQIYPAIRLIIGIKMMGIPIAPLGCTVSDIFPLYGPFITRLPKPFTHREFEGLHNRRASLIIERRARTIIKRKAHHKCVTVWSPTQVAVAMKIGVCISTGNGTAQSISVKRGARNTIDR